MAAEAEIALPIAQGVDGVNTTACALAAPSTIKRQRPSFVPRSGGMAPWSSAPALEGALDHSNPDIKARRTPTAKPDHPSGAVQSLPSFACRTILSASPGANSPPSALYCRGSSGVETLRLTL
jgi:hypothetical protein